MSNFGYIRVQSFSEITIIITIQTVSSMKTYRQTSDISCTLVGNKIVDYSDVFGASPVSTAPTTSSFST